jgi:hypothetical protein
VGGGDVNGRRRDGDRGGVVVSCSFWVFTASFLLSLLYFYNYFPDENCVCLVVHLLHTKKVGKRFIYDTRGDSGVFGMGRDGEL